MPPSIESSDRLMSNTKPKRGVPRRFSKRSSLETAKAGSDNSLSGSSWHSLDSDPQVLSTMIQKNRSLSSSDHPTGRPSLLGGRRGSRSRNIQRSISHDASQTTGIMKPSSMRNLIQRRSSSSLMIPDRKEIKKELGVGPLRFCPPAGEPTAAEQIESLTMYQRLCFMSLEQKWSKRNPADNRESLESLFLCFARCSPGEDEFNQDMAWKVMKRFDRRYLNLTALSLEDDLLRRTVFPAPGARTHDSQDVVYMRPSRFEPTQETVNAILDPIAYVLMSLTTSKESASTDGICFLMYMDGFKMTHFSADYMRHLLAILQGLKAPVRIRKVLLVNTPSWFETIWNMMTAMVTPEFLERMHRVNEDDLGKHLSGDFDAFLPDDMRTGTVDTEVLVQDYIAYRKHVEKVEEILPSRPALSRRKSIQRVTFDPALKQ